MQSPLYLHLIQIWRTWHGCMSVIPSLENFHHQKLRSYESGIQFKVLDLIFLKLIRDNSDMKKVWLRSCDHVSFLGGIGEFYIPYNFAPSECGFHTGSSYRMDTGVKADRQWVRHLSCTEKNIRRFTSFMFHVMIMRSSLVCWEGSWVFKGIIKLNLSNSQKLHCFVMYYSRKHVSLALQSVASFLKICQCPRWSRNFRPCVKPYVVHTVWCQ